jgi:SAM-dependent methyltransferase
MLQNAYSIPELTETSFDLESHLQDFLQLDPEILRSKLEFAKNTLALLAHHDFSWSHPEDFYRDKIRENYLFELSAWHLSSQEYIGETLRLIDDRARGEVLDFGGGIGTHAISAALNPAVDRVTFCDLNPIHHEFVRYRADRLKISDKIETRYEIPSDRRFDTIVCLDVLEHLPAPHEQLQQFHRWLKPDGILIANWYFFKGFDREYPFHLDDPEIVETFFQTLQRDFLEIFHPYHITVRCYRKNPGAARE